MNRPRGICIEASDHPFFRFPTHLLHPEHGMPMVFNVYGWPDARLRRRLAW